MISPKSKAEIDILCGNHQSNMSLPIITNAAFVSRRHFEEFVRGLPPDYDAVKFCFIRHSIPPQDDRNLPAGNNLTQLSLILMPMKDTNTATWESTEVIENGMIHTLCFCEPGRPDRPDRNGTGHCPPASGCDSLPGGNP